MSESLDSGGGGSDSIAPTNEQVSFADVSQLKEYVKRVVSVHLEEDGKVHPSLESLLEDASIQERIKKFITEAQVKSILFQRSSTKDEEEVSEGGGDSDENIVYTMRDEVQFGSSKRTSIALIKKSLILEADKSLAQQLYVMVFNDSSPYETLHCYMSNAIAPYFKSYVRETGRAERDGDKMAPTVEKKIAEVEMGLLHLQQNIDIPEISLPIHPVVTAVMKKCAEEGRKATVNDFADKVEDSVFLNQLQNGVNRWIREMQKVTKLDRDPASGTALQEISFWLNLERALLRIQEKRESPEVALTLDILKKGKRFHATVSFDADTRLKEAVATVNNYNPLMKDFPLNDLLSATELDKIRIALQAIFNHLRKIRNTKYPIKRALKLMEAISRDLMSQLLKVLGTRRMMHIPFDEFERIVNACFDVFMTWDDEYDKLQGIMRDIVKKKREEHLKMVWRINLAHKRLHARMDQMRKFRRQHEQLRSVIVRVLRPVNLTKKSNDAESESTIEDSVVARNEFDGADINAIEEVKSAYELVKEVDALDISKEGTDAWEAALKRYEERIDRVEARITAKLRDQLGTAKNANEMFRIFSRFNALFFRPHIRGAIREYQTQLIQRVKDDIENLHEKFKIQFPQSKAFKMSKVRDIPPVSGSILWAKQIERQLFVYMRRVEDVLGKGWENHVEGQKLKADADSFRVKLNTQAIFDEWARNVQQRQLNVSGRIFNIEGVRKAKGNVLRLKVNFMPDIIALAKEVRNLKSLGFRVPIAIVNKAHQANQLYPFAVSLIETVKSYERACEKVEERTSISLLVAGMKKEVQNLLCEGVSLVWESYKLDHYVQKLAETILNFQEKVDELLIINEKIEGEVRSIDTCAYSSSIFAEILSKIQKAVDDLSLHRYSNLNEWVKNLDDNVEKRLAARLECGIKAWTQALLGKKDDDLDVIPDTETPTTPIHKPGGDPKIQSLIHEIRITNQLMYVNPSVEEARFNLLQQLFAWENVILTLNRIESTRYQVGLDRPSAPQYRGLLNKMPEGSTVLEAAYEAIENKVKQMQDYIDQWLTYQSLWDLQPDMLYAKLGNSVQKWMNTLIEIKKSRATFDTTETRKEIGPIVVDYAKVQSKVTLKYDSWHKEVLGKFGSLLGNEMAALHTVISKSRTELEQQSIDTANTKEAVQFITYVQSLKTKVRQWEKEVEVYKEGQRILERQRFQFPSNWLHVDNIEGEWSAFTEIMRRKDAAIQTQVASLQVKIVAEDKSVEARTSDLLSEWEKSKPVEGSLPPSDALSRLTIFETKFTRLREDRDNVMKAKEALELLEPGVASISASDERLHVALEELQDLKAVWSELSRVWEQIDQLKEMPWLSIQPRKIRQQLDGLLSQLKEMPARFRQYASYDYVKRLLQGYTKVNMIIIELKSDALKERHWRQLTKQLNVRWVLSDLTLGQVWDVDLQKNEPIVKDVIVIAQGEMALEEFLKQVREAWQNYELELVNYQNKCRLIRGWDDLFNKVKEHINSITAMKLSPYYKEFEEDALAWEEKLNRINALFDVWIDVQRRWVYLEGIFSGSSDIQSLLPVETSRFHSISSEFLTLMKKVSKSPMIMDVLNIPGVQRSLERLADLLGKIQKALGEYLERERSSFPRFYFVGDEDLLEIIGNSKNIPRLQKHFKKMFAGVSSIVLDEDSTQVLGLSSKEGEEVRFFTPVSIKDYPKINEWLALVEKEMRITLGRLLAQAVSDIAPFKTGNINPQDYMEWIDKFQAQIIVLAAQISWSESLENALNQIHNAGDGNLKPLEEALNSVVSTLNVLADSVLQEQPPLRRRKLEHLITEFVHKRDVTRSLLKKGVTSPKSYDWLKQMRFYFDPRQPDVLQQLSIHMSKASFNYGFEYLGVQDKLVQTPLTDRCYLTMTEALQARLGGSPFGPAGTGKTESVKALGHQLGRFVLVFNCDETFDFQAMGRIFVGLCQVGAWGCFDEFNRLEERMLSAVSQQVQMIQETLKISKNKNELSVELVGKQVRVNPDMAIFITMNPGYAGRSNLPDNLKKLFRSLAMNKPDRQLIAEVMLFSQGFRTAEKLASKIVPFFKQCDEQLSNQSHYDFGLRALKNVLVSAGNIKRDRIAKIKEDMKARGEADLIDEASIAERLPEQEILIQSVCETMVPKLVAEDIPLLTSLLSHVFPGIPYTRAEMQGLKEQIAKVCQEMYLVCSDSNDANSEHGNAWLEKVLQLYQISNLNHGLMMVGPSGSGKSTAWKVLLKALERFEGVEGVAHVIDPKAISKEALYGVLDPNTREWTDGLFTHILRKIIDNVRGEINKRQWIIFDGDVDPEWVENLNSVLDDNKLLTLPNGERLSIPPNVRIMFEVQDLKYATLATVSRCGMIWFSEDVLSTEMIFENFFLRLKNIPLEEAEEDMPLYGSKKKRGESDMTSSDILSPGLQLQRDVALLLQPFFSSDGLVNRALDFAFTQEHIMDFTRLRALSSLFSMLNQAVRRVLNYNHTHPDFPMQQDQLEKYIPKTLIFALLWSFTGDAKLKVRTDLGDFIRNITTIPLPPNTATMPIIDYEVSINGEWVPWHNRVPQIEVETHKVAAPDVVVPTVDTVRHESLLNTWLAEHNPIVLCGPPGSGKTMTLFSSLRSLPDMEVVGLNFSSATTPELLLKTFDHYCEYRKTPNGIVLAPIQLGKWLILFCDEINLPDMDKYGTMRVISFLRQIVEHKGFYRTSDQTWVRLERIQFVGACNPPTDPGRKPLSHRFLRHVPIVYVDYPGEISLKQIYGTFNRAMLRIVPSLRAYAEPLTAAMVEFYLLSQERFTQDMQPHYVYSPRELTRWVRGICEAIRPLETLSVEGLVRLWAHEGLRLFQDRLVEEEERIWTDENIDLIAIKHFPNTDRQLALNRPILYSNWLSKDYVPVNRDELREFTKARLKIFYEEELDIPLVLFNEVLDHVLRIDRIFRQPQGHLLLIGVSGAGKTTLSRFVAWMNGLSIFQIKVHNKYTALDFDEDLRAVLRRSGCKDEKICFILDESNVLDSSFLERMNTLLANGEVPGLFEGDEFTTLMTQCKEASQREGLMLDSNEELYKWFTQQVMKNLHVVFTMNPSSEGLKDRAATSPALFNRCVLNWFGDWSDEALFQVGIEFTSKLDIDRPDYKVPDYFPTAFANLHMPPTHRHAIVNAFVYVHQTLHHANKRLLKRGGRVTTITPRHYLDFIHHYVKLFHEKCSELEDEQLHLNVGLSKIRETVEQVEELQKSLALKSRELEVKNQAANAKLKEMLKDQQEAEKKKVQSQEIQAQLKKQEAAIAEKRTSVMQDLAQVEPAVIDAQQAVQSIKKQNLVEVKSMSNPPPPVKMALESICLLLGESTTDWKVIRSVLMRENFISTIVNFQTDNITDDIRQKMKSKYLDNPDYNFDKVNRASLACGPLVKWAIAQLNYADMLKRIEPLRNELKSLESEANQNKVKAAEIDSVIAQLEKSISAYKEEYANLVSQAQAIKADLASVQAKVDRSIALLKSLSMEKERWEQSSETFKQQMLTIAGDVLLSAAFLAYAGYFDQQYRQNLFNSWCNHLQAAGILFRPDLARTEYLSSADERLRWQAHSLPSDDLCVENAIMLKRFNRYPLIIDPSGQATKFIVNEFEGKKITKTSFLDDSFRKNLESALRFGNPLLVQDVESYDPILNPVLNREVRKTGGRVLITLGDQDIDLSPSFCIFLSTRDPTAEFPPDLCSRVTFVNFTVTRSSLQSQCLNQVLKAERPDIDEKRSDLLKLQGEFHVKLRQLEKSLLQALNDAKGKILDDDNVVSTLEKLKHEAAEISRKVEETDKVMAEVDAVSQQYMPLSQACSSIYFTLEGLNQIHFLYQYSLHFFLDIYSDVLNNNNNLNNISDPNQRLSIITKDLFENVYKRVTRGMQHEDWIIFALLLCKIHLRGFAAENNFEAEFDYFLRGREGILPGESSIHAQGLNADQLEAATSLSKLPAFRHIQQNIDSMTDLKEWIESSSPETHVPQLWDSDKLLTAVGTSMHQLLVIQAFRPDRVIAMAQRVVGVVLGPNFLHAAETELNLAHIVESTIKATNPVLMCSVPGYDASGKVEDLAAELGKSLTSIAIGSVEGFSQAEKAINSSSKSGKWVMLKNVHLAPQWLVQLEKKLHTLMPHPAFRLFLTLEIHPKIPVNLLRAGRVFVFEPPPGIKANLLRTFNTIPASRMMKAPNERSRLYFLLAWFHAVVQERLRYCPLGWSKKYEFNESDLRVACDTLDTWIDSVAMGRNNLPPEKVPWDAIRTLFGQCIYGGKIDNDFDQRLLTSFINKLFTSKSFESEFPLVADVTGLEDGKTTITMPEGIRRDHFLHFVENLSDRQSPSWLGLPDNAEKVLLTNQGSAMVSKLLKLQLLEDDDDIVYAGDVEETGEHDGRPAWMRTLLNSASTWLRLLPNNLAILRRTVENIKDPLYRYFEREVNIASKLLEVVRHDLNDVIMICKHEKKQTNYHRLMVSDLAKGVIPSHWRRYTVPQGSTVIQWITDYSDRVKQLQQVSSACTSIGASSLKDIKIWLGGLFNPEAYITATRQYVAQANGWSLEELSLSVEIANSDTDDIVMDECSFGITGLKLQGAEARSNRLYLSNTIMTELPLISLRWTRTDANEKTSSRKVNLPVYLNANRSELLFTINLEMGTNQVESRFYERGVAFISSTSLG
ncbi:Dynein heavy chain: cytoplasmic-like protein [Dinothrombium tinctorium]|uniref:Dynein heavy chain, cytoplasmic n=1 Tax=Dinothrombium tinctorium TaxID=1965070 RepID=A0A443RG22_9ACAR|nr:Dynein heavy chain: cytoplasmic-like protein [Dinothrombium tinctorium]RWS15951.1 Dynein heavy chain: cytoplasmic-like protein [Dinothrombium tinctorium]